MYPCKRKQELLFLVLLLSISLFTGCTSTLGPEAESGRTDSELSPKKTCISLCKQLKPQKNLSAGPCLSDNNPNWTISDWVCDVAHSPRQQVDDRRQNQCDEWHEGQASHFVEVTPNCDFIKKR